MTRYLPAWLALTLRAFISPGTYIGEQSSMYERDLRFRAWKATRLIGLYVLGIVLYSLPLTYAGVGASATQSNPYPVVVNAATTLGWEPIELWTFLIAFAENSVFLIVGSVLVFVVMHAAVILLRTSNGPLQTVHTVVYVTGVYLAAIYSVVWTLSIVDSVEVADQIVLGVQSLFVDWVVGLTGADLELLGGTTTIPDTSAVTPMGRLLLVGLIVSVLYFVYSIYMGVRINHNGSRSTALGVVTFVVVSPALYVLGSVLFTIVTNS